MQEQSDLKFNVILDTQSIPNLFIKVDEDFDAFKSLLQFYETGALVKSNSVSFEVWNAFVEMYLGYQVPADDDHTIALKTYSHQGQHGFIEKPTVIEESSIADLQDDEQVSDGAYEDEKSQTQVKDSEQFDSMQGRAGQAGQGSRVGQGQGRVRQGLGRVSR
ncbi:hypothetical protein MIR68_002072, partial [Amoeboaphelidium protococcarum]